MSKITKCLNEWNATVEALGQGRQTILIRKYQTTQKEFLLYPTISYTLHDRFQDSFEDKSFAEENALPKKENGKTEVKYYAKVEAVIEKSPQRIGFFKDYYIWTSKHVKSYLKKEKAYIWVLRVYRLREPVMAQTTRGIMYANLKEEVSLEGMGPVLDEETFRKIKGEIETRR